MQLSRVLCHPRLVSLRLGLSLATEKTKIWSPSGTLPLDPTISSYWQPSGVRYLGGPLCALQTEPLVDVPMMPSSPVGEVDFQVLSIPDGPLILRDMCASLLPDALRDGALLVRLARETPAHLPGRQIAFICLQVALRPRVGFLLRLLPAHWGIWLGKSWSTLLQLLLGRLCETTLSALQYSQATLPRKLGGLGFQGYGGLFPPLARISALLAASQTLLPLFPTEPLAQLPPTSPLGAEKHCVGRDLAHGLLGAWEIDEL